MFLVWDPVEHKYFEYTDAGKPTGKALGGVPRTRDVIELTPKKVKEDLITNGHLSDKPLSYADSYATPTRLPGTVTYENGYVRPTYEEAVRAASYGEVNQTDPLPVSDFWSEVGKLYADEDRDFASKLDAIRADSYAQMQRDADCFNPNTQWKRLWMDKDGHAAAWSAELRRKIAASEEKKRQDTMIRIQPMFEDWE